MCHLLLVIFSLISASAAEMTPATTREFRRCSLQWVNASQVQVSCNNTLIAQHCYPHQSCRNTSKPGVSLEKDRERVCLTITDCSYDSWSCEALSYIDGEEFGENFTVNVTCNQRASTSATSGSTSTSTSPESTADGVIALIIALIIIGPIIIEPIIIVLIIIALIIMLCIYYKKVKRFWKAICDICRQQCINRTPKEEQDIELEERHNFLESENVVRSND